MYYKRRSSCHTGVPNRKVPAQGFKNIPIKIADLEEAHKSDIEDLKSSTAPLTRKMLLNDGSGNYS
jgi:hypothetical protein